MHGVELVRAVIDKIDREGFGILGMTEPPRPLAPHVVERLRFPSGAPLPPSLAAWLAFDASFVGWFTDYDAPTLVPSDVASVARAAYGDTETARRFEKLPKRWLPKEAFLLPIGRVARRFLYVSEPDSHGEYPVLIYDVDGVPLVAVENPGFDVYLAIAARVVLTPRPVIGCIIEDPLYEGRMKEHIGRTFGGRPSIQYGDDDFEMEAKAEVKQESTMMLGPADKVPDGWVVLDQMVNPFTGMPMRLAAPAAAVHPVAPGEPAAPPETTQPSKPEAKATAKAKPKAKATAKGKPKAKATAKAKPTTRAQASKPKPKPKKAKAKPAPKPNAERPARSAAKAKPTKRVKRAPSKKK